MQAQICNPNSRHRIYTMSPCDVPHPDKHQSGVGGPSDRNNNGVDEAGVKLCDVAT